MHPLRAFVTDLAAAIARQPDEAALLAESGGLLAALIARDGWLPDAYAAPHPDHFEQYLLHCDSGERFSVSSFVWDVGQRTPIHDHRVWGLVGVLRGEELVEEFAAGEGGVLVAAPPRRLRAGEVDIIRPQVGDVHRVSNGRGDGVSVSIHVYGANIAALERAAYAPDGTATPFTSGYANTVLPNIWFRSRS